MKQYLWVLRQVPNYPFVKTSSTILLWFNMVKITTKMTRYTTNVPDSFNCSLSLHADSKMLLVALISSILVLRSKQAHLVPNILLLKQLNQLELMNLYASSTISMHVHFICGMTNKFLKSKHIISSL